MVKEYLEQLINLLACDEIEQLGKTLIAARMHGQVARLEVVGRRDADLWPVPAHIARRQALVGPVLS